MIIKYLVKRKQNILRKKCASLSSETLLEKTKNVKVVAEETCAAEEKKMAVSWFILFGAQIFKMVFDFR